MVNVGISTTHFAHVMKDLGRTLVVAEGNGRIPITKTVDNITGRETLTKGELEEITAIVARVDTTWTQEEVAKLEGADGFIMTYPATTLNEHDYIVFDGNTYEVFKLITVKAAELSMFKYGLLVLKE